MKVKNRLMPNKKQVSLLEQQGPDGPVFMINLVKSKTDAIYEDGRDTNLSGREAYGNYNIWRLSHENPFRAKPI